MSTDKESKDISRRSFVKRTALGGAGLLIANDLIANDLTANDLTANDILVPGLGPGTPKSANATMIGVPFEARERVRLGIIGVGGRGTSLLGDLLAVENVDVKAICDLVPEKVAHAQ